MVGQHPGSAAHGAKHQRAASDYTCAPHTSAQIDLNQKPAMVARTPFLQAVQRPPPPILSWKPREATA